MTYTEEELREQAKELRGAQRLRTLMLCAGVFIGVFLARLLLLLLSRIF